MTRAASHAATASWAVAVCAYTADRWPLLVRAVESVQRQTSAPGSIIIVIDHNAELLVHAKRHFAGCTVIANDGTPGLSDARNAALSAASESEVVAFLDDDAHAEAEWLRVLSHAFDDPAVVGAGGRVVAEWAESRPAWFPPAFDWVVGCSYAGLPERTSLVRNVIGSNMAFRTAALRSIGGFSSRLGRRGASGAGAEETEVCIQLARTIAGSKIMYLPSARVRHTVPPSRATTAYFARRCLAEGLSKGTLASMVGSDSALATERRYVTRTLPRAAVEAVASGVRRGSAVTAAGAVAVAAGLALTAAGYAWARATDGWRR